MHICIQKWDLHRLLLRSFVGDRLVDSVLLVMLCVETVGKNRSAFGKLDSILLRPGL